MVISLHYWCNTQPRSMEKHAFKWLCYTLFLVPELNRPLLSQMLTISKITRYNGDQLMIVKVFYLSIVCFKSFAIYCYMKEGNWIYFLLPQPFLLIFYGFKGTTIYYLSYNTNNLLCPSYVIFIYTRLYKFQDDQEQ